MQDNDSLSPQSDILSKEDLLEMERTLHKATIWFLSLLEKTSADRFITLEASIEKASLDQIFTPSNKSTLDRIKVLIRPFPETNSQSIYIKALIKTSAKLMTELRKKTYSMSPDQQMIALLLTNKASGLVQLRLQSLIQSTNIPYLLIENVKNLTLKDALEITTTKIVFDLKQLNTFNPTFLTKINLDYFFIPDYYLAVRPEKTKKHHCMLIINYEIITNNESELLEHLKKNYSSFKKINKTIQIAFEKIHHPTFKNILLKNGIAYSNNTDLISTEIINKINFDPSFEYKNIKKLLTGETHKIAQKTHRAKKEETHKKKTVLIQKKDMKDLQPGIDPQDEYYAPPKLTKTSIILSLLYNFLELSFKDQKIIINTYHNKNQTTPKTESQKINFYIEKKSYSKLCSICDRNNISFTKLVNILLFKETISIENN